MPIRLGVVWDATCHDFIVDPWMVQSLSKFSALHFSPGPCLIDWPSSKKTGIHYLHLPHEHMISKVLHHDRLDPWWTCKTCSAGYRKTISAMTPYSAMWSLGCLNVKRLGRIPFPKHANVRCDAPSARRVSQQYLHDAT